MRRTSDSTPSKTKESIRIRDTCHGPALEYHTLLISSEGLGNRHTELEEGRVAIKRGIRLMQFLLIVIYVLVAGTVTVHVLLTKSDVRAALGWIAVAWLSPVFGAVLYFVFGINRVTRRALHFAKLEHERGNATGPDAWPRVPPNIAALSAIAQRVTGSPLIAGNAVSVLRGGDEAYPSMLVAIRNARHSVALGSYIFRDDPVGRSFIGALIDAHKRGVEVRVLIDGIGSGYILSSPLRDLEAAGIPTARFLHTWVPWRMPFLNMRNHKKLPIVDGTVGFTGGLNIGADHSRRRAPKDYVDGVQVRVEGPVTRQLMDTFARDWPFTTDEVLDKDAWWPPIDSAGSVAARGIHSGPVRICTSWRRSSARPLPRHKIGFVSSHPIFFLTSVSSSPSHRQVCAGFPSRF